MREKPDSGWITMSKETIKEFNEIVEARYAIREEDRDGNRAWVLRPGLEQYNKHMAKLRKRVYAKVRYALNKLEN